MTNPNGNPFAGGGERNPSLSWKDVPVGTTYECVVTAWPSVGQAKDFDSRLPLYWDTQRKGAKTTTPNDQPVQNAIVEVEIGGQPFTIFATVRGSSLFYAIAEAQTAAGKEIEPGGVLTVTYAGDKTDPENPHRKPAKQFTAIYRPPAAFAQPAPAAAAPPAAAPPAAAPAPQAVPAAAPPVAAAAPAAAAPGLTPEQIAGLQAAGLDPAAYAAAAAAQ